MTKIGLSQWVTAATNIAVLAGVLLLVMELRQNAELARLEMVQDRISTFQQAEAAFFNPELSEVWVKSVTDPGAMTLAEIRAMDAYFAIHIAQMMREHDLEKAGLVNEGATAKAMEADFAWLFGSRFAKTWWAHWGGDWPPDFVELAEAFVEAADEDYLEENVRDLQAKLGTE